ncbi:hypothetical protein JW992_10610 [candidate division KSB1 bacterium]|nr:hypothetical protein [candidate division KSB1 bacterium]
MKIKRINKSNGMITLFLVCALVFGCSVHTPQWAFDNPYAEVDWQTYQAYKANLHTHTTMSDGKGTPAEVIDRYARLKYAILSLTDHDTLGPERDRDHPEQHRTTWPWQTFGRDPDSLGMIAIEGNEISRRDHIGSFFNDYGNPNIDSEQEALDEIGRRNGLAILFHPGRYNKSVEWYVDLFRSYPHLIGFEIYNQGDRYSGDRTTWDAILKDLAGERLVWGFSNDDMHNPETQLGRNWNVLLLPDFSAEQVRLAMENGVFFYVYSVDGHQGEAPPEIRRIESDPRKGVIRLSAHGHERIDWIVEGEIVHQGDRVQLSKIDTANGTIRAVVYGADDKSLIGTQPIRFQRLSD